MLLLLLLLLPIPGSDDPFCAVAVESHFFYGWMGDALMPSRFRSNANFTRLQLAPP